MIARATAINLVSRNIGRRYNSEEIGGKPGISFTMTERKRRKIAKLIENERHLPTCLETFWYSVHGPAWSPANDIHIKHVINGQSGPASACDDALSGSRIYASTISYVADDYVIAFDANGREVPLPELVKLTDAEFNKCTASLASGKIDGKKD
jgi:hypothetical protein